MRGVNPNEVPSPYEPPTALNGSALTLRPTRAMAVFIQLGLTWTPLLWTAVKASGYTGRGIVANLALPSALLCFLSTVLIAQRWKIRLPRLAVPLAGGLIFVLIFVGQFLLQVEVFSDPDRTVLTFFLEPQSVRVSLAIFLFSSPATLWLLTVREPKDDSTQV